MKQYLVTVKLPKNPNHDPTNKITGPCPLTGKTCTDVTGQHHTILVYGPYREKVMEELAGTNHITRIEEV